MLQSTGRRDRDWADFVDITCPIVHTNFPAIIVVINFKVIVPDVVIFIVIVIRKCGPISGVDSCHRVGIGRVVRADAAAGDIVGD
jgi:hypothetical protein